MILIADGGSTKCDWALVKDNQLLTSIVTPGLSPNYLSSPELENILLKSKELNSCKQEIKEVYFFGSGCDGPILTQKLKDVLKSYFPSCDKILVQGDIYGAVYAVTQEPAVVAILGTGSNACYFDGQLTHFKIPSLGYSIGDDGSGSFLGRLVLREYFYNKMPEDIKIEFENAFDLSVEFIKRETYRSENPSKFLAGFASFLADRTAHPYCYEVLERGISAFFDNVLKSYQSDLEKYPLHFIGSIAFYAQDIIKNLSAERNIKVGKFISKPIVQLVKNISYIQGIKL